MREKFSNFFRNVNPVILILLIIMAVESMMENHMSVGEWLYTKLLILPGKGARWNGELLDAINSSFENSERKTCYDKVDGLVHFPGDQRAFKQGVAVCAVRRVPGFGRFICPTGKDNRIDDENLELLSRGLVKLAAAYQIKK